MDLGTHSNLASGNAQWRAGVGIFPAGMERGGVFLWSSQENLQVSNVLTLPKLGEWWTLNTFHNLHENWGKILPYPWCWLGLFYSFAASGSGHSPTVLSCKTTKWKDYLLCQSNHMTVNSRRVEKEQTLRGYCSACEEEKWLVSHNSEGEKAQMRGDMLRWTSPSPAKGGRGKSCKCGNLQPSQQPRHEIRRTVGL